MTEAAAAIMMMLMATETSSTTADYDLWASDERGYGNGFGEFIWATGAELCRRRALLSCAPL